MGLSHSAPNHNLVDKFCSHKAAESSMKTIKMYWQSWKEEIQMRPGWRFQRDEWLILFHVMPDNANSLNTSSVKQEIDV